jgi:hypothetical protein
MYRAAVPSSRVNTENAGTATYIEGNSDDETNMQGALEYAGAEAEPKLDMHEHLKRDMFQKAQSVVIDFDVIASPAELAQNRTKTEWKLSPHLSKEFKQNLALKNRNAASGDQLAGNLNRCIPLHMTVLQQKNEFPFPMGIQIPGMMDKNLHRHGQCVWRVAPNSQLIAVNENVFEPTNIVNAYMYDNYRLCTLEDLANDIKFVPKTNKTPGYATVAVGSLAHSALQDNLKEMREDHPWATELPHFEVEDVFEPGRNPTVHVTERIGKDLLQLLHAPVKEAADSFINLDDFVVKLVRADETGDFLSPKGINGQLTSDAHVATDKLRTDVLQRSYSFSVKARLDYLLF